MGAFSSRGSVAIVLGALAAWACAGHGAPDSTRAVDGTFARNADGALTIGPEQIIDEPLVTEDAGSPVAARSASGYLLAYYDYGANPGIRTRRLSPTGVPLAATVENTGITSVDFALASDGTNYLLAYVTSPYPYSIAAVRISGATGAVMDAVPIALPAVDVNTNVNYGHAIDAAFDGASYVVVWPDLVNTATNFTDVLGARVSPSGTLLDAEPLPIGFGPGEQLAPSVASNGTITMVAFADERQFSGVYFLSTVRLDKAGKVLDKTPSTVSDIGEAHFPRIASDGSRFLTVWQEFESPDGARYARVTDQGEVLDFNGRLAELDGEYPVVAPMNDGATFLLAWSKATTGIAGAFVRSATGDLLDTPPLTLVPAAQGLLYPFLADASPGKALLLHGTAAGTLASRMIDGGIANGGACVTALDCRTRLCVDGVCCDSTCAGSCERCGASGKCEKVTSAPDPGTCAGTLACDAQGTCKKATGSTCRAGDECSTGFCADGFCCASACDGACDVCNATPGTCTLVPEGAGGTPSCSPNRCDGVSATCPTSCTRGEQCAAGFNCDRPTKACIAGAVCADESTALATTGETTACRPYLCRAGACLTECKGIQDCIQPALCDESGRCVVAVEPAAADGGCVLARARGSRSHATLTAAALAAIAVVHRRRRRSA